MKKTTKFLISFATYLAVLLIVIVPAFSFAADAGLVPCGTSVNTESCDFNQLMNLINTVIHFILFDLAVPVAAIMFFYAGFLMITAGGEAAHARTKAKEIFTNAIIGLVFAVGAWLIIRTILSILGYDGAWIGF